LVIITRGFRLMHRQYTDNMVLTHRYLSIELKYCFGITERLRMPWLRFPAYGMIALGLQQAQLAGAGNRFGAPLDLQLVKDDAGVSLDRAQGEEKPFADFTIRESFGDVMPSQ